MRSVARGVKGGRTHQNMRPVATGVKRDSTHQNMRPVATKVKGDSTHQNMRPVPTGVKGDSIRTNKVMQDLSWAKWHWAGFLRVFLYPLPIPIPPVASYAFIVLLSTLFTYTLDTYTVVTHQTYSKLDSTAALVT
jgi:hypothetical protein